MTLGERIKKVRRALDLTQQAFAEQIGTTQNNIASYEIGRREPSAAALNNICKTFSVNETWLRTGEGEIFVKKNRNDEITEFLNEIMKGEPDFRQRLISVLARMSIDEWKILENKIKELSAEEIFQPVHNWNMEEPAQTHEEIVQEAEEYALQIKEQYILEKKREQQASSANGQDAV